jgi:hypothetical protein
MCHDLQNADILVATSPGSAHERCSRTVCVSYSSQQTTKVDQAAELVMYS